MNSWNKVKWIYINVIYYRYERDDTYKKGWEFLKILAFQSEELIHRLNDELRNYRYAKRSMKNIGIFSEIILNGISYKLISYWKL